MNTNNPIIILDNHFDGKNTFIYKNYVMNGCQFFDASDAKKVDKILNKHEVPDDVWQQALDAIESGKGTAVKGKDYSNELAGFAFRYCNVIDKSDEKMRQVILDTGEPEWAYWYCEYVSDDADMHQVIVKASDARWAYRYCRDIDADDDEMRQVLLDLGNAEWAYYYCRDVNNDDDDMRQVILDAKDPQWAYWYCCNIDVDDAEMQELAKQYETT